MLKSMACAEQSLPRWPGRLYKRKNFPLRGTMSLQTSIIELLCNGACQCLEQLGLDATMVTVALHSAQNRLGGRC